MAYRETSVPLRPARQRKRYARLPNDEWMDRLQAEWCARCSMHYAWLLLDAEVVRGGMVFVGTWRGHAYAVLATEMIARAGAPNAVSAWSAPSPHTAIKRLAFRWSQRMKCSWNANDWPMHVDADHITWPVEGEELWSL